MNKDLKIAKVHPGKRLLSVLLDYISIAIGAISLYFLLLYAFFTPVFDYQNKTSQANVYENQYGLNYGSVEDYQVYESVIQDFYLNKYPEEIKKSVNDHYKTNYSIVHIYNVTVLRLPDVPTYDNYGTEFFEYVINSDGTFAVDQIAIKKQGLGGPTYEKNMRDIFYTTYKNLKSMLAEYNSTYGSLVHDKAIYELISRISALSVSCIVFYIVIPLTNKNGSTLFEKRYDIGHVKGKNGYAIKPLTIVLRMFTNLFIPALGIVLLTNYSIILLTIFYLFINNLIFLFNKSNRDIGDLILNIDCCFVSESLIFKNRKEEKEYENSDEYKIIDEMSFIERLSDIKPINNKEENKE